MPGKLTKVDADKWRMREAAHYNGGAVFFAYLYRCVEQPRLSRFDRYEKKTRKVISTWRADGIDMPSMEDAIEALNTPPTFDADEIAFLRNVPTEFTDIREGLDWTLNERVQNKAAVEWERGKCRITETGRAAVAKSGGE